MYIVFSLHNSSLVIVEKDFFVQKINDLLFRNDSVISHSTSLL